MLQNTSLKWLAHIIVALVATTAFATCRAAPAPDASFGANGLARIGVPSGSNDRAWASAQQADGKLLVAVASSGRQNQNFLVRFNNDGTLDASFGAAGVITPAYWPLQIEPQADGSAILFANISGEPALIRITASGTLDTNFGNGGSVMIADAGGMTVQPNGKLMVVTDATQGSNFALRVRRFLPNGIADASFGANGEQLLTALPPNFVFKGLAHGTPDGGMTIAASPNFAGGTYLLLHLTPDGRLDSSYGNGGYVSGYDLGNPRDLPTQIARTPSGHTVLLGDATNSIGHTLGQVFLWQVSAQGVLNSAFGSGGRQQVGSVVSNSPRSTSFQFSVLPDGGVVASEYYNGYAPGSPSPGQAYLSRFDASGAPLPSFGVNGTATVTVAGYAYARPVGLYADPSGGVKMVSWAAVSLSCSVSCDPYFGGVGFDVALLGVTATGQPNTGFGNNGLAIWNNPAYSNDKVQALNVEPSGRLLLAGISDGSGVSDFLVSRLQPDGALDTSYANNGRLSPQQSPRCGDKASAVHQSNGALVVVSGSGLGSLCSVGYVQAFRADPTGALDAAFKPTLAPPTTANAALALGVRPDGRVVYGTATHINSSLSAVLQQMLPDGTADTSFGTAGTATFPLATGEASRQADLAVLADGSVVFAALTTKNLRVYKVDARGSPVASFGAGGQFTYADDNFSSAYTSGSAFSLFALADGSFLATVEMSLQVSPWSRWLLAIRISGDGNLKRAFTLLEDNAPLTWRLAALPDSSVLIARTRSDDAGSSAALYRLMPDDSFDASFGAGGAYALSGFSSVSALALDADGKLLVAGQDATSAIIRRYALGSISPASTGTAVEFYNINLDHYFITADFSEAAAIDNGSAGQGWVRTGYTFKSGGDTAVCRFYGSLSPGPNSHFYTLAGAECDGLKALQQSTPATQKRWNFESLDFVSTTPATGGINGICPVGTVPVYRAYNNGFARGFDPNHRIASSPAAIQEVVARGWIDEGVVMCAPE